MFEAIAARAAKGEEEEPAAEAFMGPDGSLPAEENEEQKNERLRVAEERRAQEEKAYQDASDAAIQEALDASWKAACETAVPGDVDGSDPSAGPSARPDSAVVKRLCLEALQLVEAKRRRGEFGRAPAGP